MLPLIPYLLVFLMAYRRAPDADLSTGGADIAAQAA
jgi:hypothetical protein